jgi:hypothetical protein
MATGSGLAKVMRTLCVLALLCLGFAHRVPAIESSVPAGDSLAYMLPDGTVPILCLPSLHSDASHHDESGHPRPGCDACRLCASLLLPTPTDIVGISTREARPAVFITRRDQVHHQIFPVNALARGPPAVRLA